MPKLTELLTALPTDRPVVAVVAGSGMIARCAVEAGADLLLALNAGVYRTHGVGTLAAFLPFENANQQTERLLREHLLPQRHATPIIAGLFSAEPEEAVCQYLERWQDWGVEGIVNWPAVGFFDGNFRQQIESAGIGTSSEVAMLRRAKKMGFHTFGFALSVQEVRAFLEVSVDGLILNLGLTRELDDVRERRDRIQQAVARLNEMLQLVDSLSLPPLCLAFGGPVTSAEDLRTLARQTHVRGFAGGSVFERLPVESAVVATVRRFRQSLTTVDHDRQSQGFGPMTGSSPEMQELYDLVRRVAPQNVNVCIEGETGTGKELVAIQIHRSSKRSGHPMITLNCGAIPDSLLESELFGHEKGAFTSADKRRKGKFELAHRGTLFLDEIADLSPRGQVALLRAIQQQEITPIGGDIPIPVDVRILAASNRPLKEEVAQGRFREDLYYRLNQITLRIPPLRDRLPDLSSIVRELLDQIQIEYESRALEVSPRFLAKLHQHAWFGNVRELEAVLREAAIREDGTMLEGRHFVPTWSNSLGPNAAALDGYRRIASASALEIASHRISSRVNLSVDQNSKQRHKSTADRALEMCKGNKTHAAKLLGVSRKTLYAWLNPQE